MSGATDARRTRRTRETLRELHEAGWITSAELEVLLLWRPGRRGGGYGSIALALDITPEAVRNRIQRALRRLERAARDQAA